MGGQFVAAPRWRRLIAAGIDLMVVGALAMFLALVTGAFEHHQDWVGIRPQLSALALAVASYMLVNFHLLMVHGQTLGKRLLGIRAVALSDNGILRVRWYLLRLLPLLPIAAIWFHWTYSLAFLVDVLPILLPAKRCLHDYIAGTWVVHSA